MISPSLHSTVIPLSSEFYSLKSCSMVLCGVELLSSDSSTLHVDNVIVAVVADLNVLQAKLVQDLLPSLSGDKSRRVHCSTVSNYENILGAFLSHGEVGVLQGHHGGHKVLLEVKDLFFIKLSKRNATRHQNSCRLGNTKHFPAKTLKEGCKMCLASGFSSTGSSSEHQLVYSLSGRDRILYFQVFHLVFLIFLVFLSFIFCWFFLSFVLFVFCLFVCLQL